MGQKIIIIAGEASGDMLGAWFISQQNARGVTDQYTAVGGRYLRAAGATIYRTFDDISVVGIVEIVRHLPHILRVMRELVVHIVSAAYDEVVVVDFPGFNLRLIRKLKQQKPSLRITYVSPPQMWVWGAWRVKNIRKYVDRVIVLYPFEVSWYADRGVHAEWIGSPVVGRIDQQCTKHNLNPPFVQRAQQVLLLPGSRRQEITQLMPVYASILKQLCDKHAGLTIAIVVAPTLCKEQVAQVLEQHHPEKWGATIRYITDEEEALHARAESICALTKPGTNTLELALLGVPTVVVYKTSWLTYWLARMVVKVNSMTLPNLLLKKQVFPEFIQQECLPERVAAQLSKYVTVYNEDSAAYNQVVEDIMRIKTLLTA